jgi:hypothetical protein
MKEPVSYIHEMIPLDVNAGKIASRALEAADSVAEPGSPQHITSVISEAAQLPLLADELVDVVREVNENQPELDERHIRRQQVLIKGYGDVAMRLATERAGKSARAAVRLRETLRQRKSRPIMRFDNPVLAHIPKQSQQNRPTSPSGR